MKKFNALTSKVKKAVAPLVVLGAALASNVSNAIDNTAITTAQTAATASVELTTVGMIQIVAVIVGVGLVVSLLKKV